MPNFLDKKTEEKIRTMLKDSLLLADLNKDGVVTSDEKGRSILALMKYSKDLNNDGHLDLKELKAGLQAATKDKIVPESYAKERMEHIKKYNITEIPTPPEAIVSRAVEIANQLIAQGNNIEFRTEHVDIEVEKIIQPIKTGKPIPNQTSEAETLSPIKTPIIAQANPTKNVML